MLIATVLYTSEFLLFKLITHFTKYPSHKPKQVKGSKNKDKISMDLSGFEPEASSMPRGLVTGENKLSEYIDIIRLAGVSEKHIKEVNRFLIRYLRHVKNQIEKSVSIRYFNTLKDRYSTSSYRKEVYQILKFLRYLKCDWIDEIKLPPKPTYYPKYISKESIDATLGHFKNDNYYTRFKSLILLGLDSGMRAEELYQLTNEDINLNDRIVHINHNPNNDQSTKTKMSRISFFTEGTNQALIEYFEFFNNNKTLTTLFPQSWIERQFRDTPIRVKHLRKYFSQEWDRRGDPTPIKKILMGLSLRNDVDLMHYNAQSEEDL